MIQITAIAESPCDITSDAIVLIADQARAPIAEQPRHFFSAGASAPPHHCVPEIRRS
jgi:hypothetical protein